MSRSRYRPKGPPPTGLPIGRCRRGCPECAPDIRENIARRKKKAAREQAAKEDL